MHYQLKLKDGSTVNLRFSLYFLNRVCKLAKLPLTDVGEYLMGMAEDLEVIATILAAAREADGYATGDFTKYTAIEGFQLLEQIPNALTNAELWQDIGKMVASSMFPDGLPKDDAPKKRPW